MPKLKRAILLVWQSAPRLTGIKVALIILQGILPLASLYLTKVVVDTLSASLTTPNQETAFTQIMVLLAIAGIVILATTLCESSANLVSTLQAQRVTDFMEGILHAKSIEVDLEHYEDAEYYDKLQRAQREAPSRPTQIVDRLTQIGKNSISLLAIVGLLLSFHWGMAGVLFVVAIPSVLVRLKFAKIMYHWQREKTSIRRRAGYYSALLTRDRVAKEIRLFNLGSLFSERFRQLRWQLYHESFAIATRRSAANLGAQAIAGLIMFAAYGFIIHQTVQGILTLGDLALYHQAFKQGQGAFQGLLGAFSSLYEESLFLTDLYEFLDLKPKITEPLHPQPIPQPIKTGITFNNISFQYATTTRQALNDISLTIKPGETIALVGENGSGKTTLIKLLCRLYDPTTGNITIDGIDLRHFKITDLRQHISIIFQDYMKYHLTAQENIWLGNIELSPTDEQISKAEYEVFKKFRQLIQDQAAILISHRLSTVKMADRIYVMANGSIIESGTHEELMQLDGTYTHLFETQAQHYR